MELTGAHAVVAMAFLMFSMIAYFKTAQYIYREIQIKAESGDVAEIERERSTRMWAIAISSFGIGYTWAIQNSRLTGLLKGMGLSDSQLVWAFLPGTLIGLIVQPLVGACSDSYQSSWGRRQPFIFCGALCLVVFYTLLANSYSLGTMLGDDSHVDEPNDLRPYATWIAVAAFWCADFAINACQLPVRVLATDAIAHAHQDEVMSRFSITDCAGKVFAFALGCVSLACPLFTAPGDTPFIADVRAQFFVACIAVVISFGTTVCLVEEPDSRPPYAQPWKLGLVLHQTTSIAQTSNTNSACTSGTSDSSKNIEEAAATDRTGTPRLLPQLKADFVRAHGRVEGLRLWRSAEPCNPPSEVVAQGEAAAAAARRPHTPACASVTAALAQVRDKMASAWHAPRGSSLVPLRHTQIVEGLAWVGWTCVGLWAPLMLSMELLGGDPAAMTCWPRGSSGSSSGSNNSSYGYSSRSDSASMITGINAMNQSQVDWLANGTFSHDAPTAGWPTAALFHAQLHDLKMHQQSPDSARGAGPDDSSTAVAADLTASTLRNDSEMLKSSQYHYYLNWSKPNESSSSDDSSSDAAQKPSLSLTAESYDHIEDSSIGGNGSNLQSSVASPNDHQQHLLQQLQQSPRPSLSVDPPSLIVPAAFGLPWESPGLWACGPDLARRSAFEDGLHLFSLASLVAVLASLAASPSMPRLLANIGPAKAWAAANSALATSCLGLALLPWLPPWCASIFVGLAALWMLLFAVAVLLNFCVWPFLVLMAVLVVAALAGHALVPWPHAWPSGGAVTLPPWLARWFPPHVLTNHRALCAAALIASTGVPWAVRMTVPYAITAKNYPSDALANASVNMALCVSQLSAAIFTPFFVAWGGEKPSFAFFPAAFLAATAAFFGLWMDEGKAAAAYVSTPLDDGGYRRSSVRSSTQYGGGGYVRSAAAATNGATSMDNQSDEASFSPRGRARLNESRHAYNRLPLQEDVEGEVDESGRRVHRPTEGTSRPLDQSDLEGGYIAPSAADVLAAPQ